MPVDGDFVAPRTLVFDTDDLGSEVDVLRRGILLGLWAAGSLSCGGCAGTRALRLLAAIHRKDVIPAHTQITSTDIDSTVVEWWTMHNPEIFLWGTSDQKPDDLRAFWKENLPRNGWRYVEQDQYTGQLKFERCICLGSKGHEWAWSRENLELFAYPENSDDKDSKTRIKILLRCQDAWDWPNKFLGVGVSGLTTGWMGEAAQIVGPLEMFYRFAF